MKTFRFAVLFCILSTLSCTAQTVHKATLSYVASPDSNVTYGILRSNVQGGAKIKIATGITALTYVDNALAANTQYCYQVVAEAVGTNDSSPTNEACGTTNKNTTSSPGALTITIQ